LEDRVTPSYQDLTPTITPPADPVEVTLDSQANARGSAAITAGEVDWYRFTAADPGRYMLGAIQGVSDFYPVVAVYDAAGTRVPFEWWGYRDIRATLSAGQDYLFGVTNDPGTGPYDWWITGPDGEYEDNDTLAAAADLGTLTEMFWSPDLAMLNDRYDFYRFTTTATSGAGGHVFLDSPEPGDLDLYLFDDRGEMIARSTTAPTIQVTPARVHNKERVSLNGLPAGTYTVLVYGVETNSDYDLTIDPAPGTPLADDADEENDTAATAADLGTVGAARTVPGLVMLDHFDYFTLTLPAAPGLDSVVAVHYTQDFEKELDLDLYLYDAAGNLVDLAANPVRYGVGMEQIRLNGLPAGIYTLLVYGLRPNPAYALRIDPGTLPPADDADEPNDSRATATDLGTLTAPLTLTGLALADSRDFYRFTLPATGTTSSHLDVRFEGGQGYPYVYLTDEAGQGAFGSSASNGAGSFTMNLYRLPAGEYYAMVVAVQGVAPSIAYTLTIDPGLGPYPDDRFEDNDTLATAADLGTGEQFFADQLTLNDPYDFYRFTTAATGGADSFVRVTANRDEQGHPDLYLFDAAGTLLAWSTVETASVQRVSLEGRPAGTYHALVYGRGTNPNYFLEVYQAGSGPARADDQYEENDFLDRAADLGTITADRSVGGLVMLDGYDFYRFTTTSTGGAGSHAAVSFAPSPLPFVLVGNIDLYLFDAGGNPLARSTGSDPSSPWDAVSLAGRPAGTYYLLAHSFETNPGYRLDFTLTSPAVWPIELSDFGPQAVRIPFDDLPAGTEVGDHYQALGVIFDNGLVVSGPPLGLYPVSPPNDITSTGGPASMRFPAGVVRVGAQVDTDGYNPGRQPQMRVYDAAGNLLGVGVFDQGPDFAGFEAAPGILIARVELGDIYDSSPGLFTSGDSFDNLIFETATTPPPVQPIELSDFGPQAVRISFDELPNRAVIGDTYQALGVTFDNALAGPSPYSVSPPKVFASTDGAPISLWFPAGVTRVGAQIDTDGYNPGRQPQMRVYDAAGNLLGVQNFGQGPDFVGFEAAGTPIARVLLGSVPGNDPTAFGFSDAYDNLIFEAIAP
jgi:hypothetical protein